MPLTGVRGAGKGTGGAFGRAAIRPQRGVPRCSTSGRPSGRRGCAPQTREPNRQSIHEDALGVNGCPTGARTPSRSRPAAASPYLWETLLLPKEHSAWVVVLLPPPQAPPARVGVPRSAGAGGPAAGARVCSWFPGAPPGGIHPRCLRVLAASFAGARRLLCRPSERA